jgi:hypothetical protein
VLHELLHLQLVREVERGAKRAPLCDCEPNDSASSAELQSSRGMSVSDTDRTRLDCCPTSAAGKWEEMKPEGGTNILVRGNSSRWYRSMCFANTIPAGQSWPPHPDLRSSCSLTGSSRRPEKSNAVVPAALYSGSGVRPSSNARGSNSDEDGRLMLSTILGIFIGICRSLLVLTVFCPEK